MSSRDTPADGNAPREAPRGPRGNEASTTEPRGTYSEQLLKIESKPPTISATDTANPTTLAIHLLRVKTAAAQHGFLNLLLDPKSTHTPSTNVSMVRRWIIESFECPNIRSLLATEGTHPYHVWQSIPGLLLPGIDLTEIYTEWMRTMKWDETTNIASYFSNFLMISKELERLGEPISNRRLKQLYARAIPETYSHVVDSANVHVSDTDDPKEYIGYINRAINRRLARNFEPGHTHDNDHPIFQTKIIESRRLDQRRSPNRRRADDESYSDAPQTSSERERAERYGEGVISRATIEILNEYGCNASTELVNKVSQMIGDYLLFERQHENFEAHAVDSRRPRTNNRGPSLPAARSVQRGPPNHPHGTATPSHNRARGDATVSGGGRHKLCYNCGNEGCQAHSCPHPKARCSHPLCRQRGRDGHCDKICYFQHRHLCPARLLPTRDQQLEAWEKEQNTQANYVDEDQSSDDFMQLEETINYYFYNVETDDAPPTKLGNGYLSESPLGFMQTTTPTTTASAKDDDASLPLHCIDYLADLKVRDFYDHLLHLAACVYNRRNIPIHSLIDVALSVVIDYIRRCVPGNAGMRHVKRFADPHEPNTLELVKGMCHDAVIESITSTRHDETLAGMLWRCFRSFSFSNDDVAETLADVQDEQHENAFTPTDQKITTTQQHDVLQLMVDAGVYDQAYLDNIHPHLRDVHNTLEHNEDNDRPETLTRRGNSASEPAHLALDAPDFYRRLREIYNQRAHDERSMTRAPHDALLTAGAAGVRAQTTIYDYIEPSTSTWRSHVPVPKSTTLDARTAICLVAIGNAWHRRPLHGNPRQTWPHALPPLQRLRESTNAERRPPLPTAQRKHRRKNPSDVPDNGDAHTHEGEQTPTTALGDDSVNADSTNVNSAERDAKVRNVLRLVQASASRRRRREQLNLPPCRCLWATAHGQSCDPALGTSAHQHASGVDQCMHCTPTCQCTCDGCSIPFLDAHPCSCGHALRRGNFCDGVPAVFDFIGRTDELRRCLACADPAECRCTCARCAHVPESTNDVNADDDARAPSLDDELTAVNNFELYAMQHDRITTGSHDNANLPAALRCMTYAIVDTGASTHLENDEGSAGFQTREDTTATVSTGLSTKSPCDFSGVHVQYMLGSAPDYEIICFRRPNVLCHKTFKRSLFSVRAAWAESSIKARFEDECALLLHDGRRIPFYQLNNTYVLPRWFNRADAESARALLLSPARTIPRTRDSGHDNWIQAALCHAVHGGHQNLAEYSAHAFLAADDNDPRLALTGPVGAPTGCTALQPGEHRAADTLVARIVSLYHRRFGHLSPKALLQLPNAVLGADELRRVTREQAERVVGAACDTCARARMVRKSHQKRALRTHSTTDPVHAFGDCISTDNAGPLPPSFVQLFRYLTVFVDHFTSLIAVYFHVTKGLSDSIPVRERYIADHAVYGTVKRFLSDSAGELMGPTMRARMAQHHRCGVQHTVPGESDLNTRAEAAIYLLFAMARAMRIQSGVPLEHWPAMIMYAAYVRNRVPLRSVRDGTVTTRLALARGQPHTVAEIRTFGCVCHGMLQRKERANKLSDVAVSGIFMGFPRYQQGGAVCIWVPNDSKPRYRVAYSVKFDESRTYQDAWRLSPTPLIDNVEGSHRRLHLQHHQPDTPTDPITHDADTDASPAPTSGTQAALANEPREPVVPATQPPPAPAPKLDTHACGRVDPQAARAHPTRPFDFACRLPNGHLGNCDWESLRPLRTPPRTVAHAAVDTAQPADASLQYMRDADSATSGDEDGEDFTFDCVTAEAPAAHWSAARRAPHVLLLFSGDSSRDDSLAARLRARGAQVTSYDLKIGGRAHDLTRKEVLDNILHEINCERYDFIFASPPCNSFSIANADERPQLRSKQHPQGLPTVPREWIAYLRKHNKSVEATSKIIEKANSFGIPWTIENPADRGDERSPAYWPQYAEHGSIWDLLQRYHIGVDAKIKANMLTVPTCSFDARYQKYTTFCCSAERPITHPALQTHRCIHAQHADRLHGEHPNDIGLKTMDAEQYTPKLADTLAEAIIQTATKTNQGDLDKLTYFTRMARRKSKSKRPKSKQCKIDDILRHIPIPTSYRQVLRHEFRDEIIDSMVKEHDEHLRNATWVGLVPRTPDMNVVGSTWVWDIKRHVDKRILRFKARLCAQGFTQIKGVDYFRKYSHAVSLETFRLFLAKCAMAHLQVTEADYTTAYLNAKLDTKIYMKQAEGFEERDEDGNLKRGPNGEELVYELDKAIYGLIQSGLMWEEEHWGTLKEFGWEQCSGELTIFKKVIDGVTCFLCTYVDNLFMGFPQNSTKREELLRDLGARYKINDLGEVKFSLGLCVQQNLRLGTTTIHQKPLIDEIASAYEQDMTDAGIGHRATPYQSGAGESDIQHLDRESEECKKWQLKSLKLAGKLNYVAIGTRPDIAGALSMAMQHVANASNDTYKLLLCIAKYLSSTANYAIQYQKTTSPPFIQNALQHCGSLPENPWRDGDLAIFCDASQGGARPMMCAIVFIAGVPLTWRMGKLRATTLSSTEAEWFAQSTGATVLQALDGTFTFLELEPQKPVLSFCDNKSAVMIAGSDLSTKRMKHVLTKMAYLQERISEGLITMVHIGNEGMLADIGTKRHSPTAFHRLRAFLVRPYPTTSTDENNTVKQMVTTHVDASSGGASWTVREEGDGDAEPAVA